MKRHSQWKSGPVVKGYIANSELIRKEWETCLLPASLGQQRPIIPTNLETFTNFYRFLQVCKADLEVHSNEQEPLLVLSQEVGNKVGTDQVAMGGKVVVKETKGNVVSTKVFGKGVTFNNCSFIFNI